MGISFYNKIYQNYDVISQKLLTLFQNWSHGTNFDMVLRIKELLTLIFQSLTNYFKDFTEDSPMDPPSLLDLKKVQPL